MLHQHQRDERLAAEVRAREQPTYHDHGREAAAEPQEAWRHQPGQADEQPRDAGNKQRQREPVQPLSSQLDSGGRHRDQPRSPQCRRPGGWRPSCGRYARIMISNVGSTIAPPRATSGSTAMNTQCQLKAEVSQAATGGPTNDGSTHAVEM